MMRLGNRDATRFFKEAVVMAARALLVFVLTGSVLWLAIDAIRRMAMHSAASMSVGLMGAIAIQATALMSFPFGSSAAEIVGLVQLRRRAFVARQDSGRTRDALAAAGLVILAGQLWAMPLSVVLLLLAADLSTLLESVKVIYAQGVSDAASVLAALLILRRTGLAPLAGGVAFACWWLLWSGLLVPLLWPATALRFTCSRRLSSVLNPYLSWGTALRGKRQYALLVRDSISRGAVSVVTLLFLPAIMIMAGTNWLVSLMAAGLISLVLTSGYFAHIARVQNEDIRMLLMTLAHPWSEHDTRYSNRALLTLSVFVAGSAVLIGAVSMIVAG